MDDLIVFRKSYEYLFWLKPTVQRFAKVHKYSLGVEMQGSALGLLKHIIKANYSQNKVPGIEQALVEYEVQRIYARISYEYKLLNKRQFTHASKLLEEIGRLLRGWRKRQNRQRT